MSRLFGKKERERRRYPSSWTSSDEGQSPKNLSCLFGFYSWFVVGSLCVLLTFLHFVLCFSPLAEGGAFVRAYSIAQNFLILLYLDYLYKGLDFSGAIYLS